MLYTVTPSEMRRVERRVMDKTGTPSQTLMERAAAHVADAALPYLQRAAVLLPHQPLDEELKERMLEGLRETIAEIENP